MSFEVPFPRVKLLSIPTYWGETILSRLRLQTALSFPCPKRVTLSWVLVQARSGQLPFAPEDVGSHWAADAQVDVVAISWREKAILLGEAKWGTDRVGRALVRELVEAKTPRVLAMLPDQGAEWTVHYAFFARAGFTEAAQAEAEEHRIKLVSLEQLDQDLRVAGGY